jgi:hypothetical protein
VAVVSVAVFLFLFFPVTVRVMRMPVTRVLAVFRVILIARHAVV